MRLCGIYIMFNCSWFHKFYRDHTKWNRHQASFCDFPSLAVENNIVISSVHKFHWSSILVVFGYCILLLFKVDNQLFPFTSSQNPHTNRIYELRVRIGSPASNSLFVPFLPYKEKKIWIILGKLSLRTSVVTF